MKNDMGFSIYGAFSLGIFLTYLTGFGSGLRVVTQPQPFNFFTKELTILCMDDEPAYWKKSVLSIQIMRHIKDKPIALLTVEGKIKMAVGIKDNVKAQGQIDKTSNTSYLKLIIDKPDRQDAGIYRCQMFYTNADFQMIEQNAIGNSTYKESDITRVTTHLARQIASLFTNDVTQNQTIQTLIKQHIAFDDIHSKQKKDMAILKDEMDKQKKINLNLTNEINKLNTHIDKQDTIIGKQAKLLKSMADKLSLTPGSSATTTTHSTRTTTSITTTSPITTSTSKSTGCRDGWTLYNGDKTCLKVFGKDNYNNHLTWSEAKQHCQTFGANLVTIGDKDKNDFVNEMFDGLVYFPWIGVKKHAGRRFSFKNVDGSPLGFYHPWSGPDPTRNQNNDEKCVFMYAGQQHPGKWYDSDCTYSNPYVCST